MTQEQAEEKIKSLCDSGQYERAYNLLVDHFSEPIYWHARRMVISHDDANDVTQNVFLKVWNALKEFKWESKLYSWLYRITNNESLNFIQKRKRNLATSLEDSVIQVEGSSGGFTGDEIELKLQRAVLTLPDKQRAVFNMKYFEDKKYEELSEIFETSVGALKASYHHAVKKIKAYLEVN